MDQRSLLVLLLVIERARGSSSFWAPYINMLPQQYGASVFANASHAAAAMLSF